jgi:hypothetical protein
MEIVQAGQGSVDGPVIFPRRVPAPTSWTDLVQVEPRLLALVDRAAAIRGRRCSRVYEAFKADLSRLVGWHSRHPLLGSSDAFEIAMQRLLWALGRGRSRRGTRT